MEMVVMSLIGPLVSGRTAGNDNPPYNAFFHQIADGPVHGGNPKPRTGLLCTTKELLRSECTIDSLDSGDDRRLLLSLSFRC